MGYEFLDHTSEIKIKAWGDTIEKSFEEIISAFSYFVRKGRKIKSEKTRKIVITGNDKENLLYKLVDELIYLLDAEKFLAVKGKIKIKSKSLEIHLSVCSTSKYRGLDYIKSATYSEIFVGRKNNRFEAEIVVDV